MFSDKNGFISCQRLALRSKLAPVEELSKDLRYMFPCNSRSVVLDPYQEPVRREPQYFQLRPPSNELICLPVLFAVDPELVCGILAFEQINCFCFAGLFPLCQLDYLFLNLQLNFFSVDCNSSNLHIFRVEYPEYLPWLPYVHNNFGKYPCLLARIQGVIHSLLYHCQQCFRRIVKTKQVPVLLEELCNAHFAHLLCYLFSFFCHENRLVAGIIYSFL